MKIEFYKYQGTGNDFVILENRDNRYDNLTAQQVKQICNRRFGVGADGLMLFCKHDKLDFEMIYYNADGNLSSMCGNGGRCLVKFAKQQGMFKVTYRFMAVDGPHEAEIDMHDIVRLKMQDVHGVEFHTGHAIVNTGSPHLVKFAQHVEDIDVLETGRDIRYSKQFEKEGIKNPIITVNCYVTLNRRPSQLLIDPNINLSTIQDGFSTKTWILPLK